MALSQKKNGGDYARKHLMMNLIKIGAQQRVAIFQGFGRAQHQRIAKHGADQLHAHGQAVSGQSTRQTDGRLLA
jgi:hypothetical protein